MIFTPFGTALDTKIMANYRQQSLERVILTSLKMGYWEIQVSLPVTSIMLVLLSKNSLLARMNRGALLSI